MVPQNVFSRGGSGPPAYITQNTFVKIVLFHPLAQKPPRGRICTKFGTAVGVADVITCNKFFGDRSRGGFCGVENCPFPLTKPVAVNTGLALPRSP